jgi:heterokaryon incompatibility protein (HET)
MSPHSPLYEPLDKTKSEIRLITVHPLSSSTTDDTVVCRLVKYSLAGIFDKYYALSYVWGDAQITEEILVNGEKLPVTKNLAAFLRHSRGPQTTVPLWVDAICINQSDITERNSQVLLMGQIYRGAALVLSWLGPEGDNSSLAIELVKLMDEEITKSKRNPSHESGTAVEWLEAFAKMKSCKEYSGRDNLNPNDVWNALASLLKRPYWDRAWIQQEVVLAKKVLLICGGSIFNLDALHSLYMWIKSNEGTQCPPSLDPQLWLVLSSEMAFEGFADFKRVSKTIKLRILARDEKYIRDAGWTMVTGADRLLATDPRDKIYSVLGFSSIKIFPDYNKPVCEVYYEFAKYVIEQNDLDIVTYSGLSMHEQPPSSLSKLMSWVPDWNFIAVTKGLYRYGGNRDYSAGGDLSKLSMQSLPAIHGDILSVCGVSCGEICTLEPIDGFKDILPLCTRYLSVTNSNEYPTGIPRIQAFWSVFLDGIKQFHDSQSLSENPEFSNLALTFLIIMLRSKFIEAGTLDWKEYLEKELPQLGLSTNHEFVISFYRRFFQQYKSSDDDFGVQIPAIELLQPDIRYISQVGMSLGMTLGRGLLQTKNGYLGHAPREARPGDFIFILLGCKVPLVLRQVGSYYVNIGSCFVLGFSKGEAVQDIEEGRRESQRIEIR